EMSEESNTLQTNDSLFVTIDEHHFANELLANLFWGKYGDLEVRFLVKIMLENDIFSDGNLNNNIESKLTSVISKMIAYLDENEETLKIDGDNLAEDLRPHLKQIVRKHRLGIDFERNPLFYQIKQKYNEHYKIAQKIYKLFC